MRADGTERRAASRRNVEGSAIASTATLTERKADRCAPSAMAPKPTKATC